MTDRTRTRPLRRLRGLWRDAQGGVAIIFALSATALIAFLGAGLDMSRAIVARQELSNVATMACQYSTRPSVYQVAYSNNNGVSTYQSQVNSFITHSLSNQNFTLTQSTSTPFTYTTLGSTGQVSLSASVPTLFLPIVSINSLPVSVTISCATAQAQDAPIEAAPADSAAPAAPAEAATEPASEATATDTAPMRARSSGDTAGDGDSSITF